MFINNNVKFNQYEAQNMVFHRLSGAPVSPVEGQTYYNTNTHCHYIWNATVWMPTDATQLVGQIPIAALVTNPLARANHTGTQTASTISDLATTVKSYSLDQFAVPVANLNANNFRITNVADPINPGDVGTKNYIDGALQSAAAGIDSKPSVRLVAVGNVTTSGLNAIDGVTPVAGDRILLTAQSTGSQNGVWVAASGAWTRATDADQTGEITPGAFWFVEEGTTYGKTQWRCNNTGSITLGTTAITIVQFGAATSYTASSTGGLQLIGNAFSILLPANSGLTTSAAGLQIDTTVVTRKYATNITGDGTTTTFTVTHNLNTQDVHVFIRDSSNNKIDVDWVANGVNTVQIVFGNPPVNAAAFRVTVQG